MDANRDFVDQLLDASLAGYSSAEPRTGLEQRVLARLADGPQPTAWPTWRWLPLGALATLVLAALLLATRQETVVPPVAQVPPSVVSPPAPHTPEAAAPRVVTATPKTPLVVTRNLAPRAQQFPRPGSLTQEERFLMGYLNTQPREVLVAAVRNDAGGNRPLAQLMVQEVEVPRLELKPLSEQSGDATEN